MYKTGKNNNRRCVGPFKTFGLTFLGSSEAQISNIQIHKIYTNKNKVFSFEKYLHVYKLPW